jgi:hypothetical protein
MRLGSYKVDPDKYEGIRHKVTILVTYLTYLPVLCREAWVVKRQDKAKSN